MSWPTLPTPGVTTGWGSTINSYLSALSTKIDAALTQVSVKDFGAVGDGSTDDTTAIQAAVTYAKTLVRNSGTTKQQDGAVVYFPKGLYLISSTILIDESNITLAGDSYSSAMLYAPNANFNLVSFDNASYALYNCGIRNLRFSTPGNATAGYHLTVKHAVYFVAENLFFNGWFGGMYIACCGKMMNSRLIFSQEVRTPSTSLTGSAIYLATDYGYNSDIHFTDVQIMEDINYAGVNSVVIRGCDGIYFENLHMHGTLLADSTGTGNEVNLVSMSFSNCYFDSSRDVGVIFQGSPSVDYKDIRITNCYFRGAVTGLRFAPGVAAKMITVSNSVFAQNSQVGIEMTNHNVSDMVISNCVFWNNNTGNSASYGDLRLNGNGVKVVGCQFSGGGALGYGILVDSAATNVTVNDIGFANSTVGNKILLNSAAGAAEIRGMSGTNPTAPVTAGTGTVTSGTTETRDAVLGNYVFTAQPGHRYRVVVDGLCVWSTVAGDIAGVTIRNGGASTPTTSSTLIAASQVYLPIAGSSGSTAIALGGSFTPIAGTCTLSMFTQRVSGSGVITPTIAALNRQFYVIDLGPI